ncbi:MAG: ExeM/NucH family extracellular endonuclease, partial [Anaerolineae bacterium]|nr:ExeM/NucH family extracellular endonuclease [Anaerolineae bacterium]
IDEVSFFESIQTEPEVLFIHDIQGSGLSVTNPNGLVQVEGVVVGDYQGSDELSGFFLQEEDSDADADANTSEGIFVYCGGCAVDVSEGQIVEVIGIQEEFFGMSQIDVPAATNGGVSITNAGNNLSLVTPASINLPAPASTAAEGTFEQYEGMLVEFVDELTATEYFEMARYGQIVLSEGGKLKQYTNVNAPDATGYANYLAEIAKRRIILDDLNNVQNTTDPVYHPQPGGFSTTNFIRGGYTVSSLTGVMHWSFAGQSGTDAWRIRPQITNPVSFNPVNPRQPAPEPVGGDIKVATLNVLNYFTTIDVTSSNNSGDCSPSGTLDCRGADSASELQRQTDKLVAALQAIDADIYGLVEVENNPTVSLQTIVNALNAVVGAGTYDFVNTGYIGTDAIKVAFIYRTTTVDLSGSFAVLDSSDFVDSNNTGSPKNRPALAQTFEVIDTNNPSFGEKFTAVVNHLKSKGSGCGTGDDDTTTGQGNCNVTRTKAAQKLVDWLATDPTGSGDPDFMILGDLNSYAMEDPIQAIKAGADDTPGTSDDFTNLILQFTGLDAYSYVFDGQWGYLDHALASASMAAQVTGLTEWHINSDEVSLLDYNDAIQDAGEASFEAKPGTNTLFAPDQYRVSDHDPVIIGLSLDGLEPVLVNNNLSNTSSSASYNPTPVANAPAGVYTISATFQNISAATIRSVYFEVTTLSGGNLLLNADGGPGGVGSTLSVPLDTAGEDGDLVLSPGESFTVDFEIGLKKRQGFSFFVDTYGVVTDGVAMKSLFADNLGSFTFEIEDGQLTPTADSGQNLYFPLLIK